MVIGDLHTHSTFSDGVLSIPELVDFFGKSGVRVLAITDHLCDNISPIGKIAHLLKRSLNEKNFEFYLHTIKTEAERAMREYKMLLIPGVEITKNSFNNNLSAHFLVLNIQKFINPNLSIDEIILESKKQDCLNIVAHPVSTRIREPQTYYFWNNREKYKNIFDAWELASGCHLFQEVLHEEFPKIVNSDFHKPSQINSWKTLFNCPLDVESVFKSITAQDLVFYYFEREKKLDFQERFHLRLTKP